MAQSDWDFSTTGWSIDNTQYVSSPSSLKTTDNTLAVLCKHSGCTDLEEGRVVTQFRGSSDLLLLLLHVRNQSAVGAPAITDGYRVVRRLDGDSANCYVGRWESGAMVWSASFWDASVAALAANTWYQYRVTWWQDWQGVRFRMEIWDGAAWVADGVDVTDGEDKWIGSGINRVGMQGRANMWFDDTEIYGVA